MSPAGKRVELEDLLRGVFASAEVLAPVASGKFPGAIEPYGAAGGGSYTPMAPPRETCTHALAS
jgi:hypothetical protein